MAKDNKKTLAISKSFKISKAQQYTLLEVLITSLLLGVTIVLSIWLIKYIVFNNKLSAEYGEAIRAYESTIINVGVCNPGGDKKLSDAELTSCDPNSISIQDIPETLRYNVLVEMANNQSLESVARESQTVCYDNNKKIDFSKEYQKATSDKEKEQALKMMSMCSALRVIPDALPGQENLEATMASLNQIFLLTGTEPESLAADDQDIAILGSEGTTTDAEASSLQSIPIAFSMKAPLSMMQKLLENLEISIRTFHIKTANFEWSDGALEAKISSDAYYSNDLKAREFYKTVHGGDKPTTIGDNSSTANVTTTEGE